MEISVTIHFLFVNICICYTYNVELPVKLIILPLITYWEINSVGIFPYSCFLFHNRFITVQLTINLQF